MATEVVMNTVVYAKHRYGCALTRIRPDRVDGTMLREPARVTATMTRWIARLVRDEPIVTGRARPRVYRDFLTDQLVLVVDAPAFRDVDPRDREILRDWVDQSDFRAVQIPRFVEVEVGR